MDVSYHSKAKDWLLTAWLGVCTKVQKRPRRLTLMDLYAGDGLNRCQLPDGSTESWPGSAIRMANAAKSAMHGEVRVILNEMDTERNHALRLALADYAGLVDPPVGKDSIQSIETFASMLVPQDHNFVFLDPFSHSGIRVDTLRTIASVSTPDQYHGKDFVRRPEIMFTFMTSGMQQSLAEQAIPSLDLFYGGSYWRTHVERARNEGVPVYVGFLGALMEAMNDLYPVAQDTVKVYSVRVPRGPLVYFLVFFATHPLAKNLYDKIRDYAYTHQRADVIRKWTQIEDRTKALGPRGKPIDAEWP